MAVCLLFSLLVLDEMDSLDCKTQEVLYTMFEWPSLANSKLILIGQSHSACYALIGHLLIQFHLVHNTSGIIFGFQNCMSQINGPIIHTHRYTSTKYHEMNLIFPCHKLACWVGFTCNIVCSELCILE